LKAIYVTADLLWSAPLSKNVDFEYGAGFGLGFLFGDLANNWLAKGGPNSPHTASNGDKFDPCPAVGAVGTGCNPRDHQNSAELKVNGSTEKSWVNGGSKPNLFLHLAVPQLGLRFKPIKQFQARLGIGFSLTGFWFGLSGDYGLERPPEKKP